MGFLLNDTFRKSVRFWDDPEVPRLDVDLTCERCPLTTLDCGDRVAPPDIHERGRAQDRKLDALEVLLG